MGSDANWKVCHVAFGFLMSMDPAMNKAKDIDWWLNGCRAINIRAQRRMRYRGGSPRDAHQEGRSVSARGHDIAIVEV